MSKEKRKCHSGTTKSKTTALKLKEQISKYIEKTTLLLEEKLKEGKDFIIDVTTDKCSFKSYCKKYGELNGAVYIFYLKENINFAKDKNRFFKIGRVGPKSTARFDGHHYNPKSCGSNLAKSILKAKSSLGFRQINDIGNFIRNNFIRINILFLKSSPEFSYELVEALLHYRYKPLFEVFLSQRKD